MPFKPPEVSRCPTCDRPVYAAEEKLAGGYKWHKVCFKCNMCSKFLDSTTCAEHDRKLFCKTCYGRKYGPKGVGFGGGAGALCMDTGAQFGNEESQTNGHMTNVPSADSAHIQAPEGQGCPKCGGYVYHADQVWSKGRPYHKGCFKCQICHRNLDSRMACDAPDNNVYCTGCYRKNFGLKGYGFGQGGPALISGDVHESQESMPSSAKYIDTTTIMARGNDKGCPRCGGEVFHAEQMFSKEKKYHKKCFSCKACSRPLDSMLACDGPDNDIYCKGCYSKKFGAHGYGFGGGAAFLQTADMETAINDRPTLAINTASIRGDGGKDTCPRCEGEVFHAERMLSKEHVFHKKCFTCLECNRPLDSTLCNDSPDGEIFCRLCYGKNFGPKGYGFGGTGSVPALMTGDLGQFAEERVQIDFQPNPNDRETKAGTGKGCLRCGFNVFEAEKLIAAGRNWHKRCFTCHICNRHLDSTTVNDGPDGEIYCKACYAAKFGIRGYGFGQGSGTPTLMSDGHQNGYEPSATKIHAETAFMLP